MIRQEIIKLIQKETGQKQAEIQLEHSENSDFGDYSSNIALKLKEPASELAKKLRSPLFEKVEIAGPGFVNFFLSKEYLQKQVGEILKQKENFGQLKIGQGKKVNIEFISANPTGPLHVGNGRGGFCGDVLSNILTKAGYKVFREYFINDIGKQIKTLQESLDGKEGGYRGPYIDKLRKQGVKDAKKAAAIILKEYIKPTVKEMGIIYDKWFLESDLYKTKKTEKSVSFLKSKGLLYQKDGAIWFQSTKFGDDKDRVLVKKDKEKTYFLSDIAYLKDKFDRKFNYLIIFLGAEHHGYVPRLKAAAVAFGYDPQKINVIIMQLVRLLENGKEVKMSKRTGTYVTLDELIKEIGKDVARFFFLTRTYGSHLNFDLSLAKEQSKKNPVYYIQYAHARICSILRKAKSQPTKADYKLLKHLSELNLIKLLIRFPEIVEDITYDYQVQRLPQYTTHLATAFHSFYRDCRVIPVSSAGGSEDKKLTQARLALVSATKIVLKNSLFLMGISAPEKM